MKMLKSKNIRRICVLLAMIAPAVYLFGSLFSALAGAHGQQVFADSPSEQVIDYPINMNSGKWIDSDGTIYNLSTNWVSDEVSLYPDTGVYVFTYPIPDVTYAIVATYSNGSFVSRNSIPVTGSYSFELDGSFDSVRFGLAFNVFKESLPVSLIGRFDSEGPYFDAVANSDYVFGQFFDKDNFLVKIGEDVLSDNPHGFTPFASFWKYLDENMLHMGDMQLGLMGYGYMYYCCHVLLFDIAFILVTFFLDFIQKVNDKVVGGVD